MTSLADYGIAIEINKPVPVEHPTKIFIVLKDAEYPEAILMAIQCRKTHPEEPVTIYPHGNGLYTVVREAIQ